MADGQEKLEPQLSFKMSAEVADLLTELRDAVRAAGHAKPSQRTLVQALIHRAPREGKKLESSVLAPYRRAFPEEE